MERNSEQVSVVFNNRARQVFFTLYGEFKHSTASIDRLRDENVFQQMQSKYVYSLKQQLECIAKELMERNKTASYQTSFAQHVPFLIARYTTEFVQKIRSL